MRFALGERRRGQRRPRPCRRVATAEVAAIDDDFDNVNVLP